MKENNQGEELGFETIFEGVVLGGYNPEQYCPDCYDCNDPRKQS